MVDLTIGQVAAIIAFGTVIARVWCPTIGTFILAGQLRDRETAATWTVAAQHIQSSYWPLLLRSDAIKDRGVRRPVVAITLILPLLSLLIAIAGVVTPLGLYESNDPKSEAVTADFAYVPDSSTFYAATSTRDDKPFTRTCSRDNCYFPCPYTSDVTIIVEDGLSRNCTFVGGINATVPDILHDIYTSGTQYERTTISNYFDIEWRQTTTQYDRLLDDGAPIAAGIFRHLETIALIDDVRAVEGLVVDGKNGGIGFRNHTLPSGYPRGVTWTEDLLFWEPDVECVDTNTTFDFEVTTRSQTTSGLSVSKLRLTDRGGFVDLNTTDPLDDQRNGVNKPDLRTRAYQAAWATNAFSMLFMNISNAIDPRKKNKPFEWINSEIGKHFRIPSLGDDASYFTLEFIDDFGYHLGVSAIISDTDGYTEGLYENPYNITSDSFDAARDLCQGTLHDAPTKLNNTFVLCNLIRGVPERIDDGPKMIFEDQSQWSSPLYACASAVKATVKTVTFFHNGTDAAIDNLVIKEIKDKDYGTQEEMPLWGVEDSSLRLDEFQPIWGLLHSAYETFRNISTIRAPSLYFLGTAMNGWIQQDLDPQFTRMNLPASIVPTGAFLTILSATTSTPPDYDLTGQTTLSLWLKWRELSRSASTILKLLWTDLAASAVVGTKGVMGQRNAQPDEAVDISVIPLVHRVRYRWVYGIPAFLVLACTALIAAAAIVSAVTGQSSLGKLNYRLKQTSLGRVLTTLFDPAASSFAMTAAQWNKFNARKELDFGSRQPILAPEPDSQPPSIRHERILVAAEGQSLTQECQPSENQQVHETKYNAQSG
ncbi:hypothetical protein BGZ61DRAFT_402461 [Ilyonectria robusta]|uniref:uncharacterized protein n=1 Tax=Ilyonectria robusta TaxID=1079257 RepID=UPI001E8E95C7|nr:uncharacterized protein BGZ61DRAFT_402461 [Ilyonectria robusta]KAH8662693.1 hypothetical protein BGZ61DRAFT_402461 [Ilyonectria robusta]